MDKSKQRLRIIHNHITPNQTLSHSTVSSSSSFVSCLEDERRRSSFDVKQMTFVLDEGEGNTKIREEFMKVLENDKYFGQADKYDLGIEQDRELTLRKTLQFAKLMEQHAGNDKRKQQFLYSLAAMSDQSFTTRYAVSHSLFRENLLGQATDDLINEYVPLLEKRKIYGSFCMTELGHGSYLRGLETIATFIPETEEFDIHSPTLTSTKWWIGAAGQTATHGVVFAQLVVGQKHHGVHSFLVPLRSLVNHEALPGIKIGDLGNKQGKQGVDNGFIQFNHVRIPRRNMLMKWAEVSADGTYRKTSKVADQIAYGTLVGGRLVIVLQAPYDMMRALTIAVRYSCVRRQFHSTNSKQETKLMDYQSHQFRLLPLIAQAYAMTFAGRKLRQVKDAVDKAFEEGKVYEELANAHSDSAGLKAYSTWMTHSAIDACRQAMGGHGYSKYAGISDLFNDYTINCTWEGDNTVLAQQTARHLLKAAQLVSQGKKMTGSIAYLNNIVSILSVNCSAVSEADFQDTKVQLHAYQYRTAKLIANVSARMSGGEDCQIDLIQIAKAHCYLYFLDAFIESITTVQDVAVKSALTNLCNLFALYHMQEDSSTYFTEGYMNAKQARLMNNLLRKTVLKVRQDAIAFVDAFNYSDFIINSPLGRYDGNIYPAYFERVTKNPLNQPIPPYYQSLIKPAFQNS